MATNPKISSALRGNTNASGPHRKSGGAATAAKATGKGQPVKSMGINSAKIKSKAGNAAFYGSVAAIGYGLAQKNKNK